MSKFIMHLLFSTFCLFSAEIPDKQIVSNTLKSSLISAGLPIQSCLTDEISIFAEPEEPFEFLWKVRTGDYTATFNSAINSIDKLSLHNSLQGNGALSTSEAFSKCISLVTSLNKNINIWEFFHEETLSGKYYFLFSFKRKIGSYYFGNDKLSISIGRGSGGEIRHFSSFYYSHPCKIDFKLKPSGEITQLAKTKLKNLLSEKYTIFSLSCRYIEPRVLNRNEFLKNGIIQDPVETDKYWFDPVTALCYYFDVDIEFIPKTADLKKIYETEMYEKKDGHYKAVFNLGISAESEEVFCGGNILPERF